MGSMVSVNQVVASTRPDDLCGHCLTILAHDFIFHTIGDGAFHYGRPNFDVATVTRWWYGVGSCCQLGVQRLTGCRLDQVVVWWMIL